MDSVRILKTDISVTSIHEVSSFLMTNKNVSVAICNVNTLVRCYRNEELNKILNSFSIKSKIILYSGFMKVFLHKIYLKNFLELLRNREH